MFRIVTGICFVFVAIMQFKFGQKILELDAQRYAHYFTTPRDVLANINKFLAFAFATRSVYQFLSVLSNINLPNIPIEVCICRYLTLEVYLMFIKMTVAWRRRR